MPSWGEANATRRRSAGFDETCPAVWAGLVELPPAASDSSAPSHPPSTDRRRAPRPAPRRSGAPETSPCQQVTVRWNGSSTAGTGAVAAASRVTTVTVLLSLPSTAVAMPATLFEVTVAPSAHFEMSSAKATL